MIQSECNTENASTEHNYDKSHECVVSMNELARLPRIGRHHLLLSVVARTYAAYFPVSYDEPPDNPRNERTKQNTVENLAKLYCGIVLF